MKPGKRSQDCRLPRRYLRKLRQRSGRERRFLLQAYIQLGLARSAILFFPFEKLLGWLQFEPKSIELPALDDPRISEIRWAISAAARRTPWRSACLEQAFCATRMLANLGLPTELLLGAAKGESGDNPFKAHAWLKCGNQTVTGERGRERFTLVAAFQYRPRGMEKEKHRSDKEKSGKKN